MLAELGGRLWDAVSSLGSTVMGQVRGASSQSGQAGDGPSAKGIIALVTPKAAEGHGRTVQAIMAGGTLAALTAAGAIAATAIAWLVAALAAIYFLLTRVLGLELELDPEAFMKNMQQPA